MKKIFCVVKIFYLMLLAFATALNFSAYELYIAPKVVLYALCFFAVLPFFYELIRDENGIKLFDSITLGAAFILVCGSCDLVLSLPLLFLGAILLYKSFKRDRYITLRIIFMLLFIPIVITSFSRTPRRTVSEQRSQTGEYSLVITERCFGPSMQLHYILRENGTVFYRDFIISKENILNFRWKDDTEFYVEDKLFKVG